MNQNRNKYKTIDTEILNIDIELNKTNPNNKTNEILDSTKNNISLNEEKNLFEKTKL